MPLDGRPIINQVQALATERFFGCQLVMIGEPAWTNFRPVRI